MILFACHSSYRHLLINNQYVNKNWDSAHQQRNNSIHNKWLLNCEYLCIEDSGIRISTKILVNKGEIDKNSLLFIILSFASLKDPCNENATADLNNIMTRKIE